MRKYFSITVRPEIPIANLIANDATDAPFSAQDLMWDWEAFDVPKGACRLMSTAIVVRGEDGGPQTDRDLQLLFAKSTADAVAPSSLGTPNGSVDGVGYYNLLLGHVVLDITEFMIGLDFMSIATGGIGGEDGTRTQNGIILQGEPDSGTNVGYDRLYCAGIGGASNTWDFSTGSLTTGVVGASTSPVTITTDGTHTGRVFAVGDVIKAAGPTGGSGSYKNVGTVTAVGAETSVTVDAVAEALEDNDELVVVNPITVVLGFEK